MNISNLSAVYGSMSPDDKQALKDLKAQEEKRTGKTVSLAEIIAAVTPGMNDPAYLKG